MRSRNQILIFLASFSVCQLILKLISASTDINLFVLEAIFCFINFLVDAYVLYLFNLLCFSFAETRHASGLKPHKQFPANLILNITVGLLFYRHLSHLIISIMKSIPSVLVLFRTRAMIVIQINFADPLIDIVTAIVLLWLFYKCGKFSNIKGLDKLIADSTEAKQFYANNEILLSQNNGRSSHPLSYGDSSKSIDDHQNVAFNDEEEENQRGNPRPSNLNYTATDTQNSSVDEQTNTGYINKSSLKGRLVQGGRWKEDLDSTNQDSAIEVYARGAGRVHHIDLSQFQQYIINIIFIE